MDSLASGLNWTRLLLVFTGTGLYLHLPGGALLKTDGKSEDTRLKMEPGNRYRVVRTEASLPLPTGVGQVKQGIFSELRWRGGRTQTSQGHCRPLGGSVRRGLGQGHGNREQGSSPRDHGQALLSFNFRNYNVEKTIAPSSQGDGED